MRRRIVSLEDVLHLLAIVGDLPQSLVFLGRDAVGLALFAWGLDDPICCPMRALVRSYLLNSRALSENFVSFKRLMEFVIGSLNSFGS